MSLENVQIKMEYCIHRLPTPKWEIVTDTIAFTDITYVVGGNATYNINDQDYLVSEGDLLCIPVGSIRKAYCDNNDPVESYALNIDIINPDGTDIMSRVPIVSHIGMSGSLRDKFKSICNEWILKDAGYELKMLSDEYYILHYIWTHLQRDGNKSFSDQRIVKAADYINEHYGEDISANVLAEMFQLHPYYFGKLFKQNYGIGFNQYLTLIRINAAEILLKSGEYNVTEVASLCGFNDIYYFSKVFKKIRGYSPSKC